MSLKLVGFAFLALLFCLPSWAAEKEAAAFVLRTGEHPVFDRVVFDAPRGVSYKISREGDAVSVVFSVPGKISLKPTRLSRASGFAVIAGEDGKEPLAVRFNVAPGAVLKDFMSGPSVVIDITASSPSTAPSPPEEKGGEKKDAKKEDTKEETKKAEEKEEKKEPAVVPSPAKEEVKNVLTLPAGKSAPENTVAPAPRSSPVPPVQEGERLFAPIKPLPAPMDSQTAAALLAIADEKTPAPVLTFDPQTQVGLAVFLRGGLVTILFDRKLAPPPFMIGQPQRVKAEPFDLPYNSGFRFAVPDGVEVRAAREGTVWKIFLSRKEGAAGVSTEFVTQPDFALGGRLLLPTANPPEPVFLTDPVVGDRLLVLPLRETSAFTVSRRLADLQILPAAQGLVIKPWHEKIVARIVPDGIEITSEGGLKLSPPRDTGAFAHGAQAAKDAPPALYDFARWRGRAGETFSETRQKLMRTVVDVPEDQRLLARMDLARFYFAHGMGKETLALLEVIRKSLPEIEGKTDFLALRGAARILAGDVEGGLEDLSDKSLVEQPEAMLWQAVASAFLRDWRDATDRFSLTLSFLDRYPEPFRSRFTILAVESALASEKDKEAAEWLSRLEKSEHDPSFDPAIRYLRGALHSRSGRADLAGKLWRQVAQDKDRLYKIRAELALIDLDLATKSMTPKQAAEKLEGLRFAWRGDNLEFDILRRLGGFYIESKEYGKGFGVFVQALRLYPSSPQATALKVEMKRLFKDVFLSAEGKKLSPLEALALFSNFRNLIPDGEEGNKVRLHLAERLIDIDLLDQAGNLLSDIIKNSPDPAERVQTASRLAAVRLLDHQAEAALAVLDQSQAEAQNLSKEIRDERSLLRARALSEMGKNEEAMAALPAEKSEKAELLRADIAMRAKKWDEVARTLLAIVGTPPADGAALPADKAEWTVTIALAMALGGDADGLRRLADAYGPSMDKTARADLFRILTRPEKATQPKDLAAAQTKLSEVDMFKGFLDSYRKPGN